MSGFPPTNGTGPHGMSGSLDFEDFARRFHLITQHRDSSDELIRDIIAYAERIARTLNEENASLRERVTVLEYDLESTNMTRRTLQAEKASLQADLKSLLEVHDTMKKQNPYIAVLIDGDGLLFKETWVRQGVEGGRKAANALRSFILDLCERSDGIEIIARVYLNLGDLCRVMRNAGVIEKESDFLDFAKGFSKHAHFDFVDIGPGKEEADEKLREMTKWHLRNHNCQQILLGCSHDSGYAPFLHNILRSDEIKRRISILEGFPTHRLLEETEVRIFRNRELFRSDKIVENSYGNGGFHQRPPASNGFQQHKFVSNGDIGLQPLPPPSVASPAVSVQSPVPAAAPAPAPSSTPVPVSAPAPAPPVSYAARVTKNASPPPKITLPIPPKPKATPANDKPAWNPGPRGFDAPIKVSEKVMNEIKKRKDNNKLCNNHYLRGPCAKGPDCCFEHKYKPSQEEINAIAMLARLNPCTNMQDCEIDNCIYGHHCPSVVKGVCQHPYCKFAEEDHPPGTTYKQAPKGYDNY